jgi:hypothetical protein
VSFVDSRILSAIEMATFTVMATRKIDETYEIDLGCSPFYATLAVKEGVVKEKTLIDLTERIDLLWKLRVISPRCVTALCPLLLLREPRQSRKRAPTLLRRKFCPVQLTHGNVPTPSRSGRANLHKPSFIKGDNNGRGSRRKSQQQLWLILGLSEIEQKPVERWLKKKLISKNKRSRLSLDAIQLSKIVVHRQDHRICAHTPRTNFHADRWELFSHGDMLLV